MGAVLCWGSNIYGELGNGTTSGGYVAVAVPGLSSGVRAITAGDQYTCALTTAGAVLCWGRNDDGELGDGSLASSAVPVGVVGLSSGIQAISAGNESTCALTAAGAVLCWGRNDKGQLGDGSTTGSAVPVDVSGLASGVQALSVGGRHACALTSAGALVCWGDNHYGELGNSGVPTYFSVDSFSSIPVDVEGLPTGVQAISAGENHNCALTTAGAVLCWGANGNGEIGDGSTTDSTAPVTVTSL